jgi:hypothetical protein
MVYGEVDVQIHAFMTSALVGGEWSTSCPDERAPGAHWIGGWVDTRTDLDYMKRKFLCLLGLELQPFSSSPYPFIVIVDSLCITK